jgi:hypothetical protein
MIVVMLAVAMLGTPGLSWLARGATAQDASPIPGDATSETLVSIDVPRAQLPSGDGLAIIGRGIFGPGARQVCTCPAEQGTVLIVVESGTFTYQIESSEGRIIRGANTAAPREEPAPASTPFHLAAGDALVFPGKDRIEANEGSEPASYVYALLLAPAPPPELESTGEISGPILDVIPGTWPEFTSASVTVTFQKAVLAPGESLAPSTGGLQFAVQDVAPELATPTALATGADGTSNLGQTPLPILAVSVVPSSGAGTPEA